jgi:hypothetical protein
VSGSEPEGAVERRPLFVSGGDALRERVIIKQSGRLASITAAVVALAFLTTQAPASQTADLRCNEIMSALRSGNYAAATAHFDLTMKTGFSPEQIGSIWQGLTAGQRKAH